MDLVWPATNPEGERVAENSAVWLVGKCSGGGGGPAKVSVVWSCPLQVEGVPIAHCNLSGLVWHAASAAGQS
jgi:hypothetical protein